MLLKGEMPTYTEREEKLNFYTHLFGLVASVVGVIFLLIKAVKTHNPSKIASSAVYSLTMLVLFSLSTIYHSTRDPQKRKIMQKSDHASISILIAGCGTAFLSGGIQTTTAHILTGVLWAISLIALVFNIINVRKYRAVTMTSYIVTGLMPMIFIVKLISILTVTGFGLMLGGGIVYLVGLTFYAIHKEYLHTIWHLFVLIGGAMHYFAIYFFVL